jgi:VWFA-related protein
MMRLAAALAIAAIAGSGLAGQRFKVTTEAVRVDALVTDGNKPVAGLQPGDFEIRDSGVVQQIDAVSFEEVPLSVMLALDTSHSLRGRPIEDLKNAARAVAELLQTRDRVALLTFSEQVSMPLPWTSDHRRVNAALLDVLANGATSLHDGAYAALVSRDDQAGRPLVLLFSDGQDTASWLGGQAVIEAAQRSDVVVYVVGLPAGEARAPGFRIDFRSGVQPRIPRVVPQALAEPFLHAIAADTGGSFLTVERSERLRDTFVQIVNEFRMRYLLSYTPKGVDAGGWHPIEVKLKGRRGHVTARRGYLK